MREACQRVLLLSSSQSSELAGAVGRDAECGGRRSEVRLPCDREGESGCLDGGDRAVRGSGRVRVMGGERGKVDVGAGTDHVKRLDGHDA